MTMMVERQQMTIEDLRADSVNAERLEVQVRDGAAQNLVLKAKKCLLEQQVAELKEALDALQSSVDANANAVARDVVPPVDIAPLQREIEEKHREVLELKDTGEKLQAILLSSIAEVGELKDDTMTMQRENCCLIERNRELEEALTVVRGTLARTVEEQKEARENVALLTAELEQVRGGGGPAMPSQGNSLFGEVEVCRQRLLGKYNELRTSYQELQVAYVKKCSDFSKLGADKASMSRQLADMVAEMNRHDEGLVGSLKRRVKELEEAYARLETVVQEPVKIVADLGAPELKFLSDMVSKSHSAVAAMEGELEQRSVALLATAQQLSAARHQVTALQAEVLRLGARQSGDQQTEDAFSHSVCHADPTNVLAEANALVESERAYFRDCLAVDGKAGGTAALDGKASTGAVRKVGAGGKSSGTIDGGTADIEKRITKIRFEDPADGPPAKDRENVNLGKPLEKSKGYTKLTIPPASEVHLGKSGSDRTGAKK